MDATWHARQAWLGNLGARMAMGAHGGHGPEHHGHGHGGRRHGPGGGPGGFGPGGFGPGFPFGPGFGGGWRRGGRRDRGDVRTAVLALLAEAPLHGYQIMQEIAERSGGTWRPSPGSVYPTLQQLEDEGLVRTEQAEGRRVMHLTDAGRRYVEERAEELAAVWDSVAGPSADLVELRELGRQLAAAVMQAAATGNDRQREELKSILAETRRRIYRLLAEDEPTGEGG